MNSAEHKARAEQLLAEVDPLVESMADVKLPFDEAAAYQLAALVSYAQVQAHATLALYPDPAGLEP